MVRTQAMVTGLLEYGLTVEALGRLGGRSVRIGVAFAWPRLTRAFVALNPLERLAEMDRRKREALRRARTKWPGGELKRTGSERSPHGFEVTVPARRVPEVVRDPSYSFVDIRSIEGRRPRAIRRKLIEEWYAVCGSVAIQVEGQRKGMQTVEARIVLVKALDSDDAVARLKREWSEYARPYLNSRGELVRWHLESIDDVYATNEVELDPRGVEVYSKLMNRRVRPDNSWRSGKPAK